MLGIKPCFGLGRLGDYGLGGLGACLVHDVTTYLPVY